jgi:hypothetical protein
VSLQKPKGGNRVFTQEQITQLIKHIVDDGVTALAAAIKANMSYRTALTFYDKYLENSNHKNRMASPGKYCTQEEIDELIVYMVHATYNFNILRSPDFMLTKFPHHQW